MTLLAGFVSKTAQRFGFSVSRSSTLASRLPVEASATDRQTIETIKPFTMTTSQRIWSLLQAVDYTVNQPIPGDFVECGVWRGGSIMAMTRRLLELGSSDRMIWLYDTFEGMTAPSDEDVEEPSGKSAHKLLRDTPINGADEVNVWCIAHLDEVHANVLSTGYPESALRFVKGDVDVTLRETVPEEIALLRLDTDWYQSTRTSLEVLFPKLAIGGVCILDDYGHWGGARKAVDEYFDDYGFRPLMHPIDFSGRIFLKTK